MLFPARYAQLVFSVLMSVYMVTIMTGVITWANTGINSGFLARWGHAFCIAWPIAFLLILVGAPRLRQLAGSLLRH